VWSEAVSCEILSSMFDAHLCRTEMELSYYWASSIVDYTMLLRPTSSSGLSFDQRNQKCNRLGVSVTRAMKYRGVFDQEDATRLLTKKLRGCLQASAAITEECAWSKVVLHILVEKKYMVEVLLSAWASSIERELRDTNDLIVVLTVSERSDWMFYEKKNDVASSIAAATTPATVAIKG